MDATVIEKNTPNEPAQPSLMARLFSLVMVAFTIGWACQFAFNWKTFGLKPAIGASFVWGVLLSICLLMRFRWKYLRVGDWIFFVVFLPVAAMGEAAFVGRLYQQGWHYRYGDWTFATPQSEEDKAWDRFEREFRREPGFRLITKRRFRGVNWLEGNLDSMADLDRLIAIAKKCGINREHLDGPYRHSISIIIPNSDRSKPYH